MNEHSIANGEMIEKLISDLEMCNIQNEQVNVQDIDQDCKDVGEKANQILDENSIAIGETIERKLSLMKELREIMSKKQTEQVTVQDFKDVGAQNYGEYNLEDFLFDKIIARGSYGYVLKVQLKTTKQIYALKIVNKKCVTDDIDILHTEKHVFVTASNYPFLVGLHSCFQTPSRLCFVMEFVRGFDLWFHMQKMSCLPEKHARFYAAEISLAVNFLHERGIIHRDLKPENVLLDNEGHIKLTDYGLCKKGIRAGDSTSTFCGTPNYMAPEIIRGEDYDFSVDWWALGVLLYEMLAGRSPFDIVGAAENPDQNTKDFLFQVILEKTIRIPLSVSDKAQSILKGFLNKNPAERLGCPQPNGFENITSHAFFKSIDWQLLESKQVSPPYNTNPTVKSNGNTTFTFTRKLMQLKDYLKTDDSKEIENIDQTVFEGFDYVNPLLM